MANECETKFITQKELAERWKCTEGTIINFRKRGLLSYFQLPGSKKILYPIDEIIEIENQHIIMKGGDKPKAEVKRVKPCVSSTVKEWRM